MFQEIAPSMYDNTYKPRAPKDTDIVLLYHKGCVLDRREADELCLPTVKELSEEERKELYYLFTIDETGFFSILGGEERSIDGYAYERVNNLRNVLPKPMTFAAFTALSLTGWYDTRRFCGRCGIPMKHSEKERMMQCPKCKLMEFPKISPATIIAVTDKDRILFSKYEGREYTNYALLAGFNEIGETIEETIHREVMEEVGLKVKNLRFYKSQPWPLSDSLLMGFFCELDGDDTIELDREELSMAAWFDRDKIPMKREDCSLTNDMMMAFKDGLM